MKNNRRNFLKKATIGGGFFLTGLTGYSSFFQIESSMKASQKKAKTRNQVFNMSGYGAPKIPVVRIGFIGLGNRGPGHMLNMSKIDGVEIKALCDNREIAVKTTQARLVKVKRPEAKEYFGAEDSWKALCERNDIDLVYICTPWKFHTPIAVYAMEHGKHVAIEVPAARNFEECWQLVETSERTRKHCMMMENCCYDFFEMLTLNMAQQGAFGELIHGEGAYIHTGLSFLFSKPLKPEDSPRWRWTENHTNGNPYPTHGFGPICQCMGINRGDKLQYLTSMSSNDFQMASLADKLAAGGDPYYKQFADGKPYRGNMNTSVVKTYKGRTIMIQHDFTSSRIYDRKHLISGTLGMAQKYPEPGKIAFGDEWGNEYKLWADEKKIKELEEQYTPDLIKHLGKIAAAIGGHGGMDFLEDWRLTDLLHNGLPLDQDVYDAALWSSIRPLSEWSVANQSNSIEVPDFTGGSWKTNKPVNLKLEGATTGVI